MVTANYFRIEGRSFLFQMSGLLEKPNLQKSDLYPGKGKLTFCVDRKSIITSWGPPGPSAGASLAHKLHPISAVTSPSVD